MHAKYKVSIFYSSKNIGRGGHQHFHFSKRTFLALITCFILTIRIQTSFSLVSAIQNVEYLAKIKIILHELVFILYWKWYTKKICLHVKMHPLVIMKTNLAGYQYWASLTWYQLTYTVYKSIDTLPFLSQEAGVASFLYLPTTSLNIVCDFPSSSPNPEQQMFVKYLCQPYPKYKNRRELDLWPRYQNINRNHLLIKDYPETKFESSEANLLYLLQIGH